MKKPILENSCEGNPMHRNHRMKHDSDKQPEADWSKFSDDHYSPYTGTMDEEVSPTAVSPEKVKNSKVSPTGKISIPELNSLSAKAEVKAVSPQSASPVKVSLPSEKPCLSFSGSANPFDEDEPSDCTEPSSSVSEEIPNQSLGPSTNDDIAETTPTNNGMTNNTNNTDESKHPQSSLTVSTHSDENKSEPSTTTNIQQRPKLPPKPTNMKSLTALDTTFKNAETTESAPAPALASVPVKSPKPVLSVKVSPKPQLEEGTSTWRAVRTPGTHAPPHPPVETNDVNADISNTTINNDKNSSESEHSPANPTSELPTSSSTSNTPAVQYPPKKALPLHFPTSKPQHQPATAATRARAQTNTLSPELRRYHHDLADDYANNECSMILLMGYMYSAVQAVSVTCGGHTDAMQDALVREVKVAAETASVWRTPWIVRVVSWLPNHSEVNSQEDMFTGYIVNIALTRCDISWRTIRRYSRFVKLERELSKIVPKSIWNEVCAIFPHDRVSSWLSGSNTTDKKKNERQAALNLWLSEVTTNAFIMSLPAVFDALSLFFEADSKMLTISDAQLKEMINPGSSSWRGTPIQSRISQRRASNLT